MDELEHDIVTINEPMVCYSSTCVSYARSPNDIINDSIQEAFAKMRGTLSAMACTGCGGNIDPQTLVCKCCGRQYRLAVDSDKKCTDDISDYARF